MNHGFTSSEFDPVECPVDCSRPCENVCPAGAILFSGKVGLSKVQFPFSSFHFTSLFSLLLSILTLVSRMVSSLNVVMAVAAAYQFAHMIKLVSNITTYLIVLYIHFHLSFTLFLFPI